MLQRGRLAGDWDDLSQLFLFLMPLPRRRWILYTIVALAFVAVVWWWSTRPAPPRRSSYGWGSYKSRSGSTPTPVRVIVAEKRELAVNLRAIGTVVPLNTVTVRSRVEGQLLKVLFKEGQQVEKGQLLAEIDSTPYRIRLAQMEGQLRQNEAQLLTAKSDLERFRQLHGQSLVSEQQLEGQKALVAEREGGLASDKAQVDDVRRQLSYTKIESPISGRIGLRQVDAGNLVRAGDASGLGVITQIRPIAVIFMVPESDLQKVVEPLRAGENMPVEAWDRGEEKMLASGRLQTVDNQIDLATGTLKLKAEFPNEDERLFPNQFVNVRLRVHTLKDAVVIPSATVQHGSRGSYVYVVNAQKQVEVRDIVAGPSDGPNQAITKGLQPGDKVVIEGVDRLREGRTVVLVGEGAPSGAPATVGELQKSIGESGGQSRGDSSGRKKGGGSGKSK